MTTVGQRPSPVDEAAVVGRLSVDVTFIERRSTMTGTA
jgi:hypothetical protein